MSKSRSTCFDTEGKEFWEEHVDMRIKLNLTEQWNRNIILDSLKDQINKK